jgi:Tol biopolymer transport system component
MKNILILVLISVLFLGCSTNTEPVGDSQTFLEKYQNTFWKNQNSDPTGNDYWGFKDEDVFLHTVVIETANNNQMICSKISKGPNSSNGNSYIVTIVKNTTTELWLDIDGGVNDKESFKFSINSTGSQMTVIQFYNGQLLYQENYSLTNLTYDFFCSSSSAKVPTAPTGLTGNLTSSTQVSLNWTDNSSDETGFKIERKTGSGNFTEIGSVGTNVYNYKDNSLASNSTYTYRIISYNAVGNAVAYSNEFSVTLSTSSANSNKILFESEVNDIAHLYTMNSDGSNEIKITNFTNGTNPTYTGNASWSPDGTKIIFISTKDKDGGSSIYTMNSDGTNVVRINHSTRGESNPKFSPNSTKILFSSEVNDIAHLYTMNTDGTNEIKLTNFTNGTNPLWTGEASWSPDGTKIIFISSRDNDGGSSIYTIKSDGTNLVRINHNVRGESNPKFSPNGIKVLFESEVNDIAHVYTMNSDGSNEIKITNFTNGTNPTYTGNASWSPDGAKVVFISSKDKDGGSSIYTMNSDGTNVVRINHNARGEWNPSWR